MSSNNSAYYLVDDYFITPSLDARWKNILHHDKWGDGVRVISGGNGSGKTMMARAIIGSLEEDIQSAYVELNAPMKLSRLLDSIVVDLGVNSAKETPAGENISLLRHLHQDLSASGNSAAIIIDGAQHLDDVALSALVSIVSNSAKDFSGINLFLFGAIGLIKRLDGLQVLDSPFYDFELPQFSQEELQLFLENYTERNLLDEKTSDKVLARHLDLLWSESLGMPGVALRIFENLYDEAKGHSPSDRLIKSKASRRGDKSDDAAGDQSTNSIKEFVNSIPIFHRIAVVCLLIFLLSFFIFSKTSTENETREVIVESLAPTDDTLQQGGVNAIEASNVEDARSRAAELKVMIETREQERRQKAVVSAETNSADEAAIQNETTPAMEDAKEDRQRGGGSDSRVVDLTASSASQTEQSKSQNSSVAKALTNSKYLSNSISRLKALPKNAWVLQVSSAIKFAPVLSFIKSQPNRDSLYVYAASRNNVERYIVVQGPYDTKAQAAAAIKTLPSVQRSSGAWPRSVESVQREL